MQLKAKISKRQFLIRAHAGCPLDIGAWLVSSNARGTLLYGCETQDVRPKEINRAYGMLGRQLLGEFAFKSDSTTKILTFLGFAPERWQDDLRLRFVASMSISPVEHNRTDVFEYLPPEVEP